ncbi:DUF2892 domain-containing protein [Halobacillus litoralis]|uniref:YgaP family membrane protein n=1 Tax=Halobacillus litoralis TaxID=45668 RepID=UPI001CD7B339|nr:DUF2892 domain-containing protein [Halobacillus litoralis]MCA0970615.1 DUF2892 domain-containing protein [Halobacillus litoralis]
MKPNIGIVNSMIRITAGFSMLTFLTIRSVRNREASIHPMWIIMASLKIAEGIVRYCPVTAAVEELATEHDGKEEGWGQNYVQK